MLLSIFPLSVLAKTDDLELSYQDLTKTSIEYDFKYIYGEHFNILSYPYNKFDEQFYFISAMESEDSEGKKELFFYVYNPSRKNIVIETEFDKLSLATYTSEDDSALNNYNKRDITLIDTYGATAQTKNTTNATLLKYRLDYKFEAAEAVDRYYRLADVEILVLGDENATHFIAGKEYKFFTDKSGYINCSYEDLTTLEMDAFHTFYRVDTDGVAKYTDIQSVYFPVPNKMLEMYGSIYGMNVEWYTYFTNNALVVDDKDVEDAFYKKWVNMQSSNFQYSVLYDQYFPDNAFLYDYYRNGANTEALKDYIYWDVNSINIVGGKDTVVGYKWSDSPVLQFYPDTAGPITDEFSLPIKLVFYAEDVTTFEETSVYGEEILAYLEKHNWNNDLFSPIGRGSYHNEEFTVEMKDKNLKIYTLCNKWQKLWNGDYYEVETGEAVTFSHFQQIDLSHLNTMTKEEFSKYYLIDKYDVECDKNDCGACFSCITSQEKYNDCTWFILRYDKTNYWSYDSNVIDNTTGTEKVCNSYIFRIEAIRNFDTISVSFRDVDENGIETITVFPIGRSPSNFVADAWNPKEKPQFKIDDDLAEFFKMIEKLLKIILIVLVVLVVFKIISFFKPLLNIFKRKENKNEKESN